MLAQDTNTCFNQFLKHLTFPISFRNARILNILKVYAYKHIANIVFRLKYKIVHDRGCVKVNFAINLFISAKNYSRKPKRLQLI